MPNHSVKTGIKHKVGWCSVCGWVHGTVEQVSSVKDGVRTVKPLCLSCVKKLEKKIVCAICGEIHGDNIFATVIERKSFDDTNTCNLVLLLCAKCRKIPHDKILEKVEDGIQSMCDTCPDRFVCYTSQYGEPTPSMKDNRTGFYKNPNVRR